MKASATFVALLLIAGGASAQTETTTKPDYSRPGVQKFVMSIDIEEPPHQFDSPSLYLRGLGTTWNFNYMPNLVQRLSGTELGVGVTQQLPNPFALTNTVIATSPRAMQRYRRDVNRELQKINKRLRATVDVK